MAPGRRERGGWGRGCLNARRRPGRGSAASLSLPRRPAAGALGRRPPARQVIVRSGAEGAWRTAADPCVLARRPPASPRRLGERRRRRRRSEPGSPLPGLGLLGWFSSQRLGAALALREAPGRRASAARRAGPGCGTGLGTPTTWRLQGGWPRVTGGSDGCEVSSCGCNRALGRTPLRRDGEPGRSWGRGQRRGRSGAPCGGGAPRGRVGEVVASEPASHQGTNWKGRVCRGTLLGSFLSASSSRARANRAAPSLARRLPRGGRRASGSQARLGGELSPPSGASRGSSHAVPIPFTSLFGVHSARGWRTRETGLGKSGVGSNADSSEGEEKPPAWTRGSAGRRV